MNNHSSRYNFDQLKKYLEKDIKNCICCDANDFEIFAKNKYLVARKCKKCNMISTNPYFNEEGVINLYDKYLSQRKQNKFKMDARNIMYEIDKNWIIKYVKSGDILDVGCSGGYFLSYFDKNKFNLEGVEISKEAADTAKQLYNIDVRVGIFSKLNFEKEYDLIMMRGVIEHFIDPLSEIKKATSILRKGGKLFITATPNGDSFSFEIYRDKWSLFTPDHVHFFSIENLNKIMEKFNLKYISHHYQYSETPYANIDKDNTKIKEDIIKISKGIEVETSGPFLGNMLTAVWEKV